MTLEEVVANYPDLFRWNNYYCDEGWAEIVDECCQKLRLIRWKTDIDISISQVKEKFGTLRIYLGAIQTEPGQEKWFDIIYNVVAAAERQSAQTCEVCGKYGERRPDLGWIKTLCEEHYLERKKKLAEAESK